MAKFNGPGPVFVFEVVVRSRGWWPYAARSLFVAGLLAGLTVAWSGRVAGRPLATVREQAAVGRSFFQALAGTELALALLAAPAAAAGAFGMDKARGALALLLVTDLTAAEIVLGKLGARLSGVVALVVCVLPFLALGTLLGGIDPADVAGLVLVSFGGAAVGCSLAVLIAVEVPRGTEAVLLTYAVWLAAVLVPPTWWALRMIAGVPPWPLPGWLGATSPVLLVFPPPGLAAGTLEGRARFLAYALALSALLAAVATARLRGAAAPEPLPRRRRLSGWRLLGPSLDGNPVLWREWQVRRPRGWGLLFCAAYAALAVGCTLGIVVFTGSASRGRWVACGFLNGLQVSAGLLLLSLAAASSLAEERARGSLDVLLTTPLTTGAVVWGKWWGTFRAVPLLALPPGLALTAVAWRHGHWQTVWAVVALVMAYGTALTSLGLALATWLRRPEHAAGFCAAAHVGVTVGWVLFVATVAGRLPGIIGPAIASFSPFMGVMLPTVSMMLAPAGEYHVLVRWLWFWVCADLALAALFMGAVMLTFDRCLGRVGNSSGPAPALAC